MGPGATGPTWETVKEHRRYLGWKDSVVEKVNCRGRMFVINVFITKVTNIERDTALELWVGTSVSLMGRIIKERL